MGALACQQQRWHERPPQGLVGCCSVHMAKELDVEACVANQQCNTKAFFLSPSASTHAISLAFVEQRLQLLPALRVIAVHRPRTLRIVRQFVLAASSHDSGQACRFCTFVLRIQAPRNRAHHLCPLHVQSRHPVDTFYAVLWHDVTSLAQYVEVAVNKPRYNLQRFTSDKACSHTHVHGTARTGCSNTARRTYKHDANSCIEKPTNANRMQCQPMQVVSK